ncbi:hypothetical protein [Mycoplana ramosa]|uniref:Uncharacterized protein n=1 Tax=Mycoplana ramosa TaxID=40837 RepID=A0ABW3Z200_MYCRA
MASVTRLYNHTTRKLFSIDLGSLRVMLLNENAVFTASHTTLTQVAGAANVNEVHGNGWTQGGEYLGNAAWSTVTGDDSKLDCDDPVVIATGGSIGPAYGAVIYDDSDPDKAPLAFLDFDGAISAGEGTEFKIVINPAGLFVLEYDQPA